MIDNQIFLNMLNAPVRSFTGRVELYEGSALALMCGCHDALKSFTVERTGADDKFFGYGICQKINVKLRDLERNIAVTTANTVEVVFGIESDYIYPFPNFYVTEVHRDENTNELSITAYDALYKAAAHKVEELSLTSGFSLKDYAAACAALLGLPLGAVDESFDLDFPLIYTSPQVQTLTERKQ